MDFRIAIAGTNYRVDLVILCVELLCNVLGFLCDELLQKLLCVHCLLSYALNCFFYDSCELYISFAMPFSWSGLQ